jgi:hypothetical protein
MALNASGTISMGGATTGQSINLELGQSATATIGLNDSNVRTLLGKSSGAIALSDGYGKSSFTATSLTFWSDGTYGSYNGGYFRAFIGDTVNNVYLHYKTYDNQKTAIVKFNSSFTEQYHISWSQSEGGGGFYNGPRMALDRTEYTDIFHTSDNNYFIAGGPSTLGSGDPIQITKFSKSTGNWVNGRCWNPQDYSDYNGTHIQNNAAYGKRVTVDSSGNIFLLYQAEGYYNQGKAFNTFQSHYLYKLNSDNSRGFNWLLAKYGPTSSNGGFDFTDLSVVGSNYYMTSKAYNGNNTGIFNCGVVAYNSSGTVQTTAKFVSIGGTTSLYAQRITYDSTNSVHYVLVQNNQKIMQLWQMNSDCTTRNWARNLTSNSVNYLTVTGVTGRNLVVYNGDIYFLACDPNNTIPMYLLKYNSSGILQWQRSISPPSTSYEIYNTNLSVSNGVICLTGTVSTNSSIFGNPAATRQRGWVILYSTSGSKTGYYPCTGFTLTIAASSLTDSNGASSLTETTASTRYGYYAPPSIVAEAAKNDSSDMVDFSATYPLRNRSGQQFQDKNTFVG